MIVELGWVLLFELLIKVSWGSGISGKVGNFV